MFKVLIIDDDEVLLRMYGTKLTNDGFQVVIQKDGLGATEKIREERPDLVLLDIMLPQKDGLTILAEIKKDNLTKNIPVVMMTNLAGDEEKRHQSLDLGASAYLIKSDTTPQAIVDQVETVLKNQTLVAAKAVG